MEVRMWMTVKKRGSNIGAQLSGAQLSGGSTVGRLICLELKCRWAQMSGLNCRGSTVGAQLSGLNCRRLNCRCTSWVSESGTRTEFLVPKSETRTSSGFPGTELETDPPICGQT
jgi:uncharacterized protein YjbI with pentapeptide repeats